MHRLIDHSASGCSAIIRARRVVDARLAGASLAIGLKALDPAEAQMARSGALLTDANETSILKGFWRWVFLGLPLTPNGL